MDPQSVMMTNRRKDSSSVWCQCSIAPKNRIKVRRGQTSTNYFLHRLIPSSASKYFARIRHYLPVPNKLLVMFLLLLTLPQKSKSVPVPVSHVSKSGPVSSSEQLSHQKSINQIEEEMQATQATATCNSLEPPYLKTEDKIVLSSIVFQGQLMAKSNVYNSMYFVSFRVHKVWKGRLPRREHRHVRLLFHTEHPSVARKRLQQQQQQVENEEDEEEIEPQHEIRKRSEPIDYRTDDDDSINIEEIADEDVVFSRNPKNSSFHRYRRSSTVCAPVRFNVQAGKKYLIYMKKIAHGRYVAVAQPDDYSKKIRRLAKKFSCTKCASPPKVTELRPTLTISEGSNIKLKCKVTGSPSPQVVWLKNGHPLKPDFRFSIKTKKKRSLLRVSDVNRRDMGKYTCSAKNVVGEHSLTSSITVRYTVPDPPPSNCPIESFCLNEGKCFYYEMIGELVCKCTEGFAGQRCQFKKARINLPFVENEACGPYGHDIHLREICAAWKRPPVTEMTREEYDAWLKVEDQLAELRRQKELEQMEKFRQLNLRGNMTDIEDASTLEALSLVQENDFDDYDDYNNEEITKM